MSEDSLQSHRSDVIERSIRVEWLMAIVISQHYLGRVDRTFLLEFLYDEYCSFALKRRVVEKIADGNAAIHNLNRLNNIRNLFAHCGPEIESIATGDMYVPNSARPDERIDFGALYDEFRELAPTVTTFLLDLFLARGGRIEEGPSQT